MFMNPQIIQVDKHSHTRLQGAHRVDAPAVGTRGPERLETVGGLGSVKLSDPSVPSSCNLCAPGELPNFQIPAE